MRPRVPAVGTSRWAGFRKCGLTWQPQPARLGALFAGLECMI